jgi:hypothetical protein
MDVEDYSLDESHSYGLLQHYGMPTPIVDFTKDIRHAFAFAVSGSAGVARMAVMKPIEAHRVAGAVDFTGHPWAERAQRQAAFGIYRRTIC